jgi:RNA 2',3'-cyclic 3'-phosphodiesterase
MFLALDLPAEARSALAAWRDGLVAGRDDLRPVRPEALHVTLVFLGWQDEAAAEAIGQAAFEAAAQLHAPLLRADGVRPLPPRDPRLFALDLEDEQDRASAVQAAASDALCAGGWYHPEKRPFWPHVTLARVKRGRRRVPPLADAPAAPGEAFAAAELTLYRSTLRPQGALYEPLGQARLA